MIKVTHLNESELVVKADLIEFIEPIPDTIIPLTTGKKTMVTETIDRVIERVTAFKQQAGARPERAGDCRQTNGS